MSRRRSPDDDYPAEVLTELRRQLEHASAANTYYPAGVQRSTTRRRRT
jgi:hypothetical protein